MVHSYAGTVPMATRTYTDPMLKELLDVFPLIFSVAEHDPVGEDGVRYADLLNSAGVQAESTMVHGYIHPALLVPAIKAMNRDWRR